MSLLTTTTAGIALQRPPMPTEADQARATHQRTRLELLTEEHHDVASDWRVEHIGDERAAVQGPLDLSVNPIANICRQLSTPGHYGARPTITHADAAGLDLVERMDDAGYWTRMQEVEYLALGLGDVFVAHGWDTRSKALSYRIVFPHNVMIFTSSSAPDVPIALWELGTRVDPLTGRAFYAWDQYDISDPANPTYRIVRASTSEADGDPDVTAQYLPADFPEPYPWRLEDGAPILRHVRYRDADTGRAWNTYNKRGAHHGTLNSIVLASYMMHCARDASGRTVIMVGVEPLMGSGQGIGSRDRVATAPLLPGTIAYHQATDGAQPMVVEVGPGAHLAEVAAVSSEYEIRQAIRWGLNPADITRQHANPTSGAALAISNKAKREFADRTTPIFRRVDRQALALSAVVSRVFGGISSPESGYAISYSQIPMTPDELAAERDDDDWQLGHSLKSPIDLYIERHPGATRESALAAIAQAIADKQAIDDEVARITGPPPPPPPPAAEPEDDDSADAAPDTDDPIEE